MPLIYQNQGIVGRYLTNVGKTSEGSPNFDRHSPFGELYVQALLGATLHPLADEGSYFIAENLSSGVPGTGIAISPATGTTFSATQGCLTMYNGDLSLNPKNIYLDFIAFKVTAAPTATTNGQFAHSIDIGNRGSAGTALTTRSPNGNIALSAPSVAVPLGGQPTIAAASNSVRYLGTTTYRTSVGAVGDVIILKFGVIEATMAGGVLNGTNASGFTIPAPPIVIGGNQSYVLNEWAAGRSAAISAEMTIGWWER